MRTWFEQLLCSAPAYTWKKTKNPPLICHFYFLQTFCLRGLLASIQCNSKPKINAETTHKTSLQTCTHRKRESNSVRASTGTGFHCGSREMFLIWKQCVPVRCEIWWELHEDIPDTDQLWLYKSDAKIQQVLLKTNWKNKPVPLWKAGGSFEWDVLRKDHRKKILLTIMLWLTLWMSGNYIIFFKPILLHF